MRKPISNGTRFEIFKRDAFTCQYCGRKPPEVILHVDHILAVANGGTNEYSNLITSCSDCNLAKSDKPLERKKIPPIPNAEQIADERERFEQLKQYQQFLNERDKYFENQTFSLLEAWADLEGQKTTDEQFFYQPELKKAVTRFLKYLPASQILEAMQLAHQNTRSESQHQRQKYFYGVCWRKIKKDIPQK